MTTEDKRKALSTDLKRTTEEQAFTMDQLVFKPSTLSELEVFAAKLAGNWDKMNSFYWEHASDDDAQDWGIYYTGNRDADLLTQSNAAAIAKVLEADEFADDVRSESHSHWAVGHVDGYSIRIYRNGTITPAAAALFELVCALEEYPCLDESDFSEREYADTARNIEFEGRDVIDDEKAPEGWAYDVYRWLDDNEPGETDPRDGFGGYPDSDAIARAATALGFASNDDE